LDHATAGDSILMIEDASVGAIQGSLLSENLEQALIDKKIYVLGADFSARGLDKSRIIDGVEIVDYSGFVDLTIDNETTQSWL